MPSSPTRRKLTLFTGLGFLILLAALAGIYWGEVKSRYLFWRQFERLAANEQSYSEYRHRQTGIVFVRLPGGTFWMGSSREEVERMLRDLEADEWKYRLGRATLAQTELPRHGATLAPFLIAKYEVTQAEWVRVMGGNPSNRRGDDLPVEMVSWEDCQEFCRKTRLPLPTEAQWEYACRGGAAGRSSGTGSLDDMGWILGNSGDQTHPVGQKMPNGFGLYDMHGNVSEPCADVFDPGFYSKPEALKLNPVATSGSTSRVQRGGSYYCHATACYSGSRNSHPSTIRRDDRGFRPAFYPLP